MLGKNKIRSIYSGGFNPTLAARLALVKLPEETRCVGCNKHRPIRFFSQIQQNSLRNGIASRQVQDATGSWITCTNCTGKQITELKCIICRQWMGLDAFAKAQRRGGDNARCLNCVADHLETPTLEGTAPEAEANELIENDSEDEYSDVETNFNTCNTTESGVRLPSSMIDNLNEQNVQALNRTTLSHQSTAHAKSAISGWQSFTGYDANGQAHARARAPSTEAQSENGDSEGFFEESKPSPRAEKNARAQFARLGGGRGIRHHRPAPNNPGCSVAGVDSDEDPESDEEFAL